MPIGTHVIECLFQLQELEADSGRHDPNDIVKSVVGLRGWEDVHITTVIIVRVEALLDV